MKCIQLDRYRCNMGMELIKKMMQIHINHYKDIVHILHCGWEDNIIMLLNGAKVNQILIFLVK